MRDTAVVVGNVGTADDVDALTRAPDAGGAALYLPTA
jgi:hypothetical protein